MQIFNFLKDENGKYYKEEILNGKELPNKFEVIRDDGTVTKAFNMKINNKVQHKDKSISYLITGKVFNNKDAISANSVCFEVPEGRLDLAKEVIKNNTGMDLNNNSYTYVGRAFSNDDIRLQPPTMAINSEIEKLNKRIEE